MLGDELQQLGQPGLISPGEPEAVLFAETSVDKPPPSRRPLVAAPAWQAFVHRDRARSYMLW